jgi:cell division protease FtsH
MAQNRDFSEQTAIEIDTEIKEIVHNAYEKANALMQEHREALDKIAAALLERESLSGVEIDELIGLEPKDDPDTDNPTDDETATAPSATDKKAEPAESTSSIASNETDEDSPSETPDSNA